LDPIIGVQPSYDATLQIKNGGSPAQDDHWEMEAYVSFSTRIRGKTFA